MSYIGLDIGGANIKWAVHNGPSGSLAFPLWKRSHELPHVLRSILQPLSTATHVAVTMTGELADCYPNRRTGVAAIVRAVMESCASSEIATSTNFPDRQIFFYAISPSPQCWVSAEQAVNCWEQVAASNWYATATFVSRWLPEQSGFLIDMGSTTTDIIPIRHGQPIAIGKTDFARLGSGELMYAGIQRTPISSLLDHFLIDGKTVAIARELFATVDDAALLCGLRPDALTEFETADGRAATRQFASQRLARLIGLDADQLSTCQLQSMADQTLQALQLCLLTAFHQVRSVHADLPPAIMVCGQGESWLKTQCQTFDSRASEPYSVTALSCKIGSVASNAGAAYALAQLAMEQFAKPELNATLALGCAVKPVNHKPVNHKLMIRVIKIGGSLLNWDHTPERLQTWLDSQSPALNVFVCGGGPWVELIRRFDQQYQLTSEQAHRLSIAQMSQTLKLVAAWFPAWKSYQQFEQLASLNCPANCLFDVNDWLRQDTSLPASWDVTSDSIAAQLAIELNADELVLLKSRPAPVGQSWAQLGTDDYVDRAFPQIAAKCKHVRMVDLHDATFAETSLRQK